MCQNTNCKPLESARIMAQDQNSLVWLDMEMTGLVPERDRIIEIAVVVTNAHLGQRTEGPVFAVHQSDAVLDAMDAWNKGTHGRSGLIERVRASAWDEEAVQTELLAWLKRYVPKSASPMCGNSICQDRLFFFHEGIVFLRHGFTDIHHRFIELTQHLLRVIFHGIPHSFWLLFGRITKKRQELDREIHVPDLHFGRHADR